jgi:xeroderma pigmentosum group C-complementing protein
VQHIGQGAIPRLVSLTEYVPPASRELQDWMEEMENAAGAEGEGEELSSSQDLFRFTTYPVDSQVLGCCKGEPVFSRDCVFTLHTRETWLKEGRVVKKDEEPYKVVKARPKKGQLSLEREASTVEVFGPWQTEVYLPPPVTDGVVPRNEYGNVELFQPSMLPAGASHIRIAGIHKVARKLGLSYAPAMVGWDFHSGHCCPVIDGIVVAQENEEVLMEAWRQEEQMAIEREIKKREARALERWRKIVRGVLIRETVQRTYSLT